ncbi:hypothetical protein G7067_13250 [Leucobacter insecticola]|uniref:Uncharacterized protein n=1 Tax=Leucobacter insecticola TaxID=2714934 RepID=A0A6G8FL44_9MICO|nr:hypothetical protein [Leucobacter insecticola]QIM17156.1 hypothetical protein G7067_13250 [Leucobacter insecticola]
MSKTNLQNLRLEPGKAVSKRWATQILEALQLEKVEVRRKRHQESLPIDSPSIVKTFSLWLYEDVHLQGNSSSTFQAAEVASPVGSSSALMSSRRASPGWQLRFDEIGRLIATSTSTGTQLLVPKEERPDWVIGKNTLLLPRVRKGFLTGWDSLSGSKGTPLSPNMRIYLPWIDSHLKAETLTSNLDQCTNRWLAKFANFETDRPDRVVLYCSDNDARHILDAIAQTWHTHPPKSKCVGPGFSVKGPFDTYYAVHLEDYGSSFGITVAQQAAEYLSEQLPDWSVVGLAEALYGFAAAAETTLERER